MRGARKCWRATLGSPNRHACSNDEKKPKKCTESGPLGVAGNRSKAPKSRLSGGFEAGATGLEPATSGVTGRRSNQLNYAPDRGAV